MNVVQIRDRTHDSNIGSQACLPATYFPELRAVMIANFEMPPTDSLVIYGGGGKINDQHTKYAESLLQRAAGLVGWGIGHNQPTSLITYPSYLSRFALCGVRDWDSPFRWVPCVSCMSPLFDRTHTVTRPFVAYIHPEIRDLGRGVTSSTIGVAGVDGHVHLYPRPDCLAKIVRDAPVMENTAAELPDVLAFLGSAETVVTDSYHGAYWATLLGRRVVAIPHSSRMLGLRHSPMMVRPNTRELCLQSYPEALAQCRAANLSFYKDVMDLLNRSGVSLPPAL